MPKGCEDLCLAWSLLASLYGEMQGSFDGTVNLLLPKRCQGAELANIKGDSSGARVHTPFFEGSGPQKSVVL